MRVTTKKQGSIKNTMNFLNRILSRSYMQKLEQYGQMGVDALAAATPRRTGKTAASWGYEIFGRRLCGHELEQYGNQNSADAAG